MPHPHPPLSRLTATAALCAVAALAVAAAAQPLNVWRPIGPQGATVLSLARDPLDSSTVWIGCHFGGLYRSLDAGASWTHIPTAFSGEGVTAIEILPTTPRTIYVASIESGVYRSLDGGATWQSRSVGLDDPVVRDLVVDPSSSGRLLAATFSGVYVSDDAGASWTLATTDEAFLPATSLLFDPTDPAVVYAGSQGLGVFRSLDRGESWSAFTEGVGLRDVVDVVVDPADPATLYAAATNGVFQLPAGQSLWRDITFDLPSDARVASLAFVPGLPGLFAATDKGVYRLDAPPDPSQPPPTPPPSWSLFHASPSRFLAADDTGAVLHLAGVFNVFLRSTDQGQSFTDASTGVQNHFIGALAAVDAGADTTLYAGTGTEVLSAPAQALVGQGPAAWTRRVDLGGAIFELAPHPSDPNTLYVGSEVGGVRVTHDAGATWRDESTGLVPQDIVAIDQDRAGAGSLYAATEAGIYVSFDDGQTWEQKFQAQNPAPITDVEADPVRPNFAYYSDLFGQLFRTQNGGDVFTPIWSAPAGEHVVDIEAAPFMEIYAVTSAGFVYTSNDLGANFFRRGADDIKHHALTVLVNEQRPWIAYVGTVFGGVYKSTSNAINWSRRSKGMDVPIVFSLAMDPVDDEVLYAGALGAVYRSTNGAASWKRVSQGLPSQAVVARLAVDPHTPSRLYAWITGDRIDPAQRGLYRSDDAGAAWTRLETGFTPAGGLLPSRTTPDALLAGSHVKGLFFSGDAGASWQSRSDGMAPITLGLAVDHTDPALLYAATATSGLFRSVDGAATWSHAALPGVNVFNVSADPSSPGVAYAATPIGPLRTLDAGRTWTIAGQRVPFAFDVAVDPQDPQRVYVAGTGGKLFRSDDGGQTWTSANRGLPLIDVQALACDPRTGDLYAALERDGVYRSSDQGANWRKVSLKPLPHQFLDMEIDPATAELYLATNDAGVLWSRDSGATWKNRRKGLTGLFVADLALQPDPRGRSVLFAAVRNDPSTRPKSARTFASVFRSTNRGKRWRPAAGGLDETGAFAVVASSAPLGPIFAADADGAHRSDDLGRSWSPLPSATPLGQIAALALDEANDLLYATSDAGVFVCDLASGQWTQAALPDAFADASGNALAVASDGALYAATLNRGLLFSRDFGSTMQGGVDPTLSQMVPHMVVADPSQPDVLYAALQTQGMARSDDRGATWRLINNGLGARNMFTVTVDPSNPQTVYATSNDAGVWVSDDGGATWSELNEGLFNTFVTALAIDPNNPKVIYAGTEGGGAFRLVRP